MVRKNIVHRVLPEIFQKIVKESNSITEVLNKIGCKNKSGKQYASFYERIKEENLSITHFNKFRENKKYNLSDILIENSNYTAVSCLKTRLIKGGYLEYKCYGLNCIIRDEWLNKPLTLHLDHINGINNDNRLENLRFLCPNCHSQTGTYSGKNVKIGKQKYESLNENDFIPKEVINKKIKIIKEKRKIPSIETLLKDIEEFGYRGTGRKYNVTDNAIRKWLKNDIIIKNKPRKIGKPICIDCKKEIKYGTERCYQCSRQNRIIYLRPNDMDLLIDELNNHTLKWCENKYSVKRWVIYRWLNEYKKLNESFA